MEALALAKEKLRTLEGGYRQKGTLEDCKARLVSLDESMNLPHLAYEIDQLKVQKSLESLFSWFVEYELPNNALSYLPLLIGLLKSKS